MAGIKLRKAREAQRPTVSQRALAELLGKSRGAIQGYEEGKTEPKPESIKIVSRKWRIPEEWFWDGKDSPLPPKLNNPAEDGPEASGHLTSRQTSTNMDVDLSLLGPKTKVRAFLGGSARPFLMSSDQVEEVEIPFALSEDYIIVMVTDGTLGPEIRSDTVLVFEKKIAPVENSPLLVESAEEEGKYAIRRFDPDGAEGQGTFIDRKGVLGPLSRSEWRMRGVLTAMTARGGLVV